MRTCKRGRQKGFHWFVPKANRNKSNKKKNGKSEQSPSADLKVWAPRDEGALAGEIEGEEEALTSSSSNRIGASKRGAARGALFSERRITHLMSEGVLTDNRKRGDRPERF